MSFYVVFIVVLVSRFFKGNSPGIDIKVITIILFLPVLLYHFLFEYFMDGQSPGKKIMEIKVVNIDGTRPKLSGFLLRWIFRFIDIQLLFGSVALAVILFHGKGQRLGDIVAGTMVIDIKNKESIAKSITLANDIEEEYVPVFPQVTVLEDKDIEKIKEIYREARAKYNMSVLKQMANKIKSLTGIESDMPEIKFIKTVMKDYYYLTRDMN